MAQGSFRGSEVLIEFPNRMEDMMKSFKAIELSGAAFLLLTGAVKAAGQSTPQELAQTKQLNLEQAQKAQQQNAQSAQTTNLTPAGGDGVNDNTTSVAPMALNSLSNPPNKVATATVIDDKGTPVGVVKNVETDATGKPSKVNVSILGSQQIIALDSSTLSYDEPHNVLIAALDESQIMQTPVAPLD
jgi:hypothetical protein